MKYKIGHYYGNCPPVPEAIKIENGKYPLYEVDITDIHEFVENHGPIIISPPGHKPQTNDWWIWVTDHTGRFTQK